MRRPNIPSSCIVPIAIFLGVRESSLEPLSAHPPFAAIALAGAASFRERPPRSPETASSAEAFIVFCVWRFLCLLFVSLVAFIEPPLQLAIGPQPLSRGQWLGLGCASLILLLRLCERGIGDAESHIPQSQVPF